MTFVFDVSNTEPEKNAPPLPANLERPFDVRKGHEKGELGITINNAKRDGISVCERKDGSQRAGSIEIAKPDSQCSSARPRIKGCLLLAAQLADSSVRGKAVFGRIKAFLLERR